MFDCWLITGKGLRLGLWGSGPVSESIPGGTREDIQNLQNQFEHHGFLVLNSTPDQ